MFLSVTESTGALKFPTRRASSVKCDRQAQGFPLSFQILIPCVLSDSQIAALLSAPRRGQLRLCMWEGLTESSPQHSLLPQRRAGREYRLFKAYPLIRLSFFLICPRHVASRAITSMRQKSQWMKYRGEFIPLLYSCSLAGEFL